MLKIHDSVRNILESDDIAVEALSRKILNLSSYAKRIQPEVEEATKKEVSPASIAISLARIRKELKQSSKTLIQNVDIENITTHAPLSEISYEKTDAIIQKVSALYKKIKTTSREFFTIILSTEDLTVICSERLVPLVLEHFDEKPQMQAEQLAAIGISIDKKYYPLPNITYTFLKRIALKRIALAETITSHREILFVFSQKHLAEVLALFPTQKT